MKKEKKDDTAYATAKAIVGSFPVVGAAASEILSLLIASPVEKRRNKLLEDIGGRLLELEKKSEINFEQLVNDELFIDVVMEALNLALKTGCTS